MFVLVRAITNRKTPNAQRPTSNVEHEMIQAAVNDRRLQSTSSLIRERGGNGCLA